MHGEDLLINDRGNREAIEAISECLPQLNVVSPLALVVKAIDAINRSTLMVAPENKKVFWVLNLICKEETDCLKRLFTPVHIITQEEVVGFRWKASILEET